MTKTYTRECGGGGGMVGEGTILMHTHKERCSFTGSAYVKMTAALKSVACSGIFRKSVDLKMK